MTPSWIEFGRASIGYLWLPLLGWTAIAGAAWLWMRSRVDLHPLSRFRWSQALLFALPFTVVLGLVLPMGRVPVAVPGTAVDVGAADGGEGGGVATVTADAPVAPDAAPAALASEAVARPAAAEVIAGTAALATLVWWLFAVARLGSIRSGLADLHRWARSATPVAGEDEVSEVSRLRERLAIGRPVRLVMGPEGSAPMTFGLVQPTVSVPPAVLNRPGELRMTLVHELVHIARNDFGWGLAERVIHALVPGHPLIRRLVDDIEAAREASCDLTVLASGEADAKAYASLLYTHGTGAEPFAGIATGLSRNPSQLITRIETMKSFANKAQPARAPFRNAVAAALILGSTAVLGACFSFERGPVVEEQVAAAAPEFVVEQLDRDGLQALARLEAQIDYLAQELDDVEAQLIAEEGARGRGEAIRSTRRLRTRLDLLEGMYADFLRTYEEVKLQAVANSLR